MITFLLLSNLYYFLITILSAFVFFTTGLLYFDAWQVSKKHRSPFIRAIGFSLLALASISALFITETKFAYAATTIMTIGLGLILFSLTTEPVLKKPNTKIRAFFPLLPSLTGISVIAFLGIGIAYLIKAKRGLEKQLWPAGVAFIFLFLAQLLKFSQNFLFSENIVMIRLFETFGPMWYLQMSLLLIGSGILGLWAWGYIRFRLQLQIFISTLLVTLLIFITTTAFFSFFLLKNIEREALASLEINGKVFQYTLERLQFEALNNAKTVAADPNIVKAFTEKNTKELGERAQTALVSQRASTLVITDRDGLVNARGEDTEKNPTNLSNNPFVRSALDSQDLAGIFAEEGVITPFFYVGAAAGIKENAAPKAKTKNEAATPTSTIVGSVLSAFLIDNGFLDGVKSLTGLDVSLYSQDTRSATTLLAPNGVSRYVGSKESNKEIIETVLNKGEAYVGTNPILNQPYYVTYLPLKQNGGKVIGMLAAGQPQIQLQATAQEAINSTFVASGLLILTSILPIYLFSRYLKENIEA